MGTCHTNRRQPEEKESRTRQRGRRRVEPREEVSEEKGPVCSSHCHLLVVSDMTGESTSVAT